VVSIVAAGLILCGPTWPWGGRTFCPRALAQDDDLGLDLSGDKDKDKKKKKQPPKPPPKQPKPGDKKGAAQGGDDMGFDGLDVSVKSAEKEQMDKALDLMKDEDYASAAALLWDLYNNPKAKSYFQAVEYQLSKALYRMGLYHSSLAQFGKVLEKGLEHKYFKTSLEWLFFISHKITDQAEVLKDIARFSDIEFPKKYKDEFMFLLGKYFYFRALDIEKGAAPPAEPKKEEDKAKPPPAEDFGFDLSGGGEEVKKDDKKGGGEEEGFGLSLETEKKAGPTALPTDAVGFLSKAKSLIMQIGDKSKFYAKAKYLEGIIAYKEENFQSAVEAFKEVVKILNPQKGKIRDDTLREMAFFQLARTHYAHKQFRYALFYYDHITRDSEGWLESLFEASWAWFRLGKYQKALGNLITLDSPFFREEYFPEGLVLKAVTYYENCRYPESNQIVKDFKDRYEPLFKELDNLLKKAQSPESYYKQLLAIQEAPPEGQSGKILRRILKVALADKDLKVLNTSVREIDREISRIGKAKEAFSRSKLAERLVAMLKQRKEDLMKSAGLLTKKRLEGEREFLGSLLNQAMRITLENKTAELDMLTKAQTGATDIGPTLKEYEWSPATDDEKIYWPYEGEYWRDELGTYEYTLVYGCRKQVE
jgi:hypothetical protein